MAENIYNAAVELVDRNIDKGYADKIAIYYREQEISYGELFRQVNKAGNAFKGLGIQIENRVLLLLPDCPHFFYAFLGAIKAGAVAVPVNTLSRPQDYFYVLNDSRAKVLVIAAELLHLVEPVLDQVKYLQHIVVVGEAKEGQVSYDNFITGQPEELSPAETCADDVAFWIYSSGTTGAPKGVVHLQHDMIYAAETYPREILALTPDDIIYSTSKLFFAYGLGNSLYFPLRSGAAAVLCPDRPDPRVVIDTITKYRPTIFFSVPTTYNALLQADIENPEAFRNLRICVSSGEPLPEILFTRWKERFDIEIVDGMGCSELCNTIVTNRPGAVVPGSAGRILTGYEARIIDENGNVLPSGEAGTLQLKGDSVAAGYWNQHEKTKESFAGHWFTSGDRFYMDEAENLYYVGRADDMIKAGGIYVSPIEVEGAIMKHDAVSECGVIGKKDDNGLSKPQAFIVLKAGFQASAQLEKELQEFVKEKIAHYKYPRWIRFVSELPKGPTGKIQRYKLRALEKTEDNVRS
ncbi:MAG: benzoate-CoA ligase family protein [Thermincola sp.]|nr:benzoate-CoA ligase family protein [Thermincola sp.]MDT3703165.1 benzoate-CoA ligase family protein [Thermincola sp.]